MDGCWGEKTDRRREMCEVTADATAMDHKPFGNRTKKKKGLDRRFVRKALTCFSRAVLDELDELEEFDGSELARKALRKRMSK